VDYPLTGGLIFGVHPGAGRAVDVDGFDKWAPSYDIGALQTVLYHPMDETVLRAAAHRTQPRRLLDLGCGTGDLLRRAAGSVRDARRRRPLPWHAHPPRARGVFDRAARCANDLGLLAEQADPATGGLLGNFPQAFSHLGLVNAAESICQSESTQDRMGQP
jgi:hypothetical protein